MKVDVKGIIKSKVVERIKTDIKDYEINEFQRTAEGFNTT
jgi:hypothetical protein